MRSSLLALTLSLLSLNLSYAQVKNPTSNLRSGYIAKNEKNPLMQRIGTQCMDKKPISNIHFSCSKVQFVEIIIDRANNNKETVIVLNEKILTFSELEAVVETLANYVYSDEPQNFEFTRKLGVASFEASIAVIDDVYALLGVVIPVAVGLQLDLTYGPIKNAEVYISSHYNRNRLKKAYKINNGPYGYTYLIDPRVYDVIRSAIVGSRF